MVTVHYFKLKIEAPENDNVFTEALASIVEDDKLVAVGEFKTYEVLYTFLEEQKVTQLIDLFIKYDVLIEEKDLTNEILEGSYDDPDFIETFSEDITYFNLLESFIFRNLDVNDILDKILEKGIESITDIEKKILASQ